MDPLLLAGQILVFPGFLFFIALCFLFEWVDRKFYADIQKRIGPLYTGPVGILQPVADFIKLMTKEDLTPKYADKKVFNTTPLIMVATMLTALMVIPVSGVYGLISFNGDIIFTIAALTFFTILVFLAGYSSNNAFSAMGAERAVLQLLGYEVPLMLSIVGVCIYSGSITIGGIVSSQAAHSWNIFGPSLLGLIIFIIAAQAELERLPFDIPEAEQEIVAGWMTEYSGRKLAFLRLAKDLGLVFISALVVVLYLGGPTGPAPLGQEYILYPIYFLAKTAVVILVLSTIRGVFARIRVDQMISFAWRYLIPISLIQLMITILWRLL